MPTTDNIEGENLGNIFHYQEHAIVVQSRWKAFLYISLISRIAFG